MNPPSRGETPERRPMNELERLKRELEYAKSFKARLPQAEKELLRRTQAVEVRLGYVRDLHQGQAVAEARLRQDELKAAGRSPRTAADPQPQSHRLAVLAEEFGEVSREVCEGIINGKVDAAKLRAELVQVAAVALAWLEALE